MTPPRARYLGGDALSSRERNRWGSAERTPLSGLPREVAALRYRDAPLARWKVRELEPSLIVTERVDEQLVVRPLYLGPPDGRIGAGVEHPSDDAGVAASRPAAGGAELRVGDISAGDRHADTDSHRDNPVVHEPIFVSPGASIGDWRMASTQTA